MKHPRPFMGFCYQDLGQICLELAERLDRQVPSRERADLDERISAALKEVADRLILQRHHPNRPEYLVERFGPQYLAESFMERARINLRNERARLLNQACGYVLGGAARIGNTWGNAQKLGINPNDASQSDEQLWKGLAALQEIALKISSNSILGNADDGS